MANVPNPFSEGNFRILKKLIREAVRNPDAIDKVAKHIVYLFGEGEEAPRSLKTRAVNYTSFISMRTLDVKDILDNTRDGGDDDCPSSIFMNYSLEEGVINMEVSGATTEEYNVMVQVAPAGGTISEISSGSTENSRAGRIAVALRHSGRTDQYHYYVSVSDRECTYAKGSGVESSFTLNDERNNVLELRSVDSIDTRQYLSEVLPRE